MPELHIQTVDKLCASVDFTLEEPTIDLSSVSFFQPFALVYLGMFVRYHSGLGKRLRVILPTYSGPRTYLAVQNFWRRFNFAADVVQGEDLLRFTSSTSLSDIIDIERRDWIAEDIGDHVLRILSSNNVRVAINSIAELVVELVDNFSQHSERPLAACAMQWYPKGKRVVFAIGDCGVGIRNSLGSVPEYQYLLNRPHYESAVKAFEPLVTRKSEGGMGLTDTRSEVEKLGGRLFLSTGDGYVSIAPDGVFTGHRAYDLPGVQIELSFPEG